MNQAKTFTVLRDGLNPADFAFPDVVLTYGEFAQFIKSGLFLNKLFRYRDTRLLVPDLRATELPALSAVLLRLLSHGRCGFEDIHGRNIAIGTKALATFAARLVRDLAGKRSLLQHVSKDVRVLFAEASVRPRYNPSASPVYLRSDFTFGLQCGGSIGHIAGVLNNLEQFSAKPIFLTTDTIPTVRDDIPAFSLDLGRAFWDFPFLPLFHFNFVFRRQSAQLLKDLELAFVYHRMCPYHYCGAWLARARKVPFVLEYNGSEVWINRNWGTPKRYDPLCESIEKANLRAADLIVVVSDVLRESLVNQGIAESTILVNPNGVDTDLFSPRVDPTPMRGALGLEGKTVLGFIGTFGRWHGAEVLAQAFAHALQKAPEMQEQLRLLYVGDGLTMAKVKRIVQELGIESQVLFTGFVPQAEAPNYLAACDILVSPHVPNADGTRFFGSPTKLFEYMAMAKGIVASDLDQIGEVLEHGKTAWLTQPGDPRSLTQGILRLARNTALRQRLGNAARKMVETKYTWRAHTERIVNAIAERFS